MAVPIVPQVIIPLSTSFRCMMGPPETARSLETMIHNTNAPYSTFNNASGHRFNITYIHPSAGASPIISSSPPSSNLAPFNDAPVGRLSFHFTGRKKELTLIAKTFEKCWNILLPCVLFGKEGVGKSQLTCCTHGRTQSILRISAATVEKLYQGFVGYSTLSTTRFTS
jgi:hypothetical protein